MLLARDSPVGHPLVRWSWGGAEILCGGAAAEVRLQRAEVRLQKRGCGSAATRKRGNAAALCVRHGAWNIGTGGGGERETERSARTRGTWATQRVGLMSLN